MHDLLDRIIADPNANPSGNKFSTLSSFMGLGLNILMGIGIAVSTLAIILSGIHFIMSQGDFKATDTAKRYLTTAIIAFGLSIGAFTVKIMLLGILGGGTPELKTGTPGF